MARRNHDLRKAISETNRLQRLLPVCSFCKKIRDEEGHWYRVEFYIESPPTATFTHTFCEACVQEHYSEIL